MPAWQMWMLILGGIAAGLTILGVIWRFLRRVTRAIREIADWVASVRGDPQRGHPGMAERVVRTEERTERIETGLKEHLRWHDGGGIAWVPPSSNGMPPDPLSAPARVPSPRGGPSGSAQ